MASPAGPAAADPSPPPPAQRSPPTEGARPASILSDPDPPANAASRRRDFSRGIADAHRVAERAAAQLKRLHALELEMADRKIRRSFPGKRQRLVGAQIKDFTAFLARRVRDAARMIDHRAIPPPQSFPRFRRASQSRPLRPLHEVSRGDDPFWPAAVISDFESGDPEVPFFKLHTQRICEKTHNTFEDGTIELARALRRAAAALGMASDVEVDEHGAHPSGNLMRPAGFSAAFSRMFERPDINFFRNLAPWVRIPRTLVPWMDDALFEALYSGSNGDGGAPEPARFQMPEGPRHNEPDDGWDGVPTGVCLVSFPWRPSADDDFSPVRPLATSGPLAACMAIRVAAAHKALSLQTFRRAGGALRRDLFQDTPGACGSWLMSLRDRLGHVLYRRTPVTRRRPRVEEGGDVQVDFGLGDLVWVDCADAASFLGRPGATPGVAEVEGPGGGDGGGDDAGADSLSSGPGVGTLGDIDCRREHVFEPAALAMARGSLNLFFLTALVTLATYVAACDTELPAGSQRRWFTAAVDYSAVPAIRATLVAARAGHTVRSAYGLWLNARAARRSAARFAAAAAAVTALAVLCHADDPRGRGGAGARRRPSPAAPRAGGAGPAAGLALAADGGNVPSEDDYGDLVRRVRPAPRRPTAPIPPRRAPSGERSEARAAPAGVGGGAAAAAAGDGGIPTSRTGSDAGRRGCGAAVGGCRPGESPTPLSFRLQPSVLHRDGIGLGLRPFRPPGARAVLVERVLPGSWGDRSGVRPGWRFVSVGGRGVGDEPSLWNALHDAADSGTGVELLFAPPLEAPSPLAPPHTQPAQAARPVRDAGRLPAGVAAGRPDTAAGRPSAAPPARRLGVAPGDAAADARARRRSRSGGRSAKRRR
eukprot:gene6084-758_t